jgi:hypothetical protein
LSFLWLWALKYLPSGNTSTLTPAEISTAADWTGDANVFVSALKRTGWIDRDGMIHDWHEYAGKYLAHLEKDRERKRQWRANGKLPEPPPPASAGSPPEVTRNSGVTEPDITRPNLTGPKRLNDEGARAREAESSGAAANRSSINRAQERALLERLAAFVGEDEMARAGGHWVANWIRKKPDLLDSALADLELQVREGREATSTRGAWLTDLLNRWQSK